MTFTFFSVTDYLYYPDFIHTFHGYWTVELISIFSFFILHFLVTMQCNGLSEKNCKKFLQKHE